MTGVQKLLKNGTPTEIAAALSAAHDRKCTRQLVEYWDEQGYVTPKWAPLVNRTFGIPLHELNPTIYPQDSAA